METVQTTLVGYELRNFANGAPELWTITILPRSESRAKLKNGGSTHEQAWYFYEFLGK